MANENRVDKNMNEQDAKKQEPKKKKHTGRNVAIGLIAALLLSTGGYYGLGPGQGNLPFNIGGNESSSKPGTEQNQQNTEQQSSAPESSTIDIGISDSEEGNSKEEYQQQEEGVFLIIVSQDKIIVGNREMDEKTLEDYLSETFITGDKAAENMENLAIKVKDDKAIKSTYDVVTAILNKLDLSFTEEKEN